MQHSHIAISNLIYILVANLYEISFMCFDIICLRPMQLGLGVFACFFSSRNHVSVKLTSYEHMNLSPLKIVTYSGLGVFEFLVNVTFYASVTTEIEITGY